MLYFNNESTEAPEGASLFECAESLGIYVPTSCVKQGKCRECMVEVTEGMDHLTPKVHQESHLTGNLRLSCRARVLNESGTIRCHTLRRSNIRVERHALHLPARRQLTVDPAITRKDGSILCDEQEIGRGNGSLYGIAMDLGTTTVVLRLINLETGEIVADSSFENPQRFGGSDVMSRIHFDTMHRGKLLQRTLAGYVSHAIEKMPADPNAIYEMVVAGNSTMRDLFFRLNVYSIGQNPYQSITEIEMKEGKRSTTSVTTTPKRLALPLNPQARVYGLPIISGHVGADTSACMMAIDIANEDRLVAIMDIGTNTELILGNKHKILAASCPAGPAFEGGKIFCGMPALPGAIEQVEIQDNGTVNTRVIGDVPSEGICGSGLVDVLSELMRTGRMNSLGRFGYEDKEFILDSSINPPVQLNESDINELAQAKGANVAGLHIIFERYGVSFDDVDQFYLAGAFGRHINIQSAKRIGLIPNIDDSKIVQVGNASIEGASAVLISRSRRAELEELVKRVEHCRLETHPDFFNYFVEGCQFHPVDSLKPHAHG
ncbi:MAG: ASKHA domain-containing protein [Ignavibacteriae bacterium]|nr:ASKHA domain-containing protein [Ignavibacteriota bacterium]